MSAKHRAPFLLQSSTTSYPPRSPAQLDAPTAAPLPQPSPCLAGSRRHGGLGGEQPPCAQGEAAGEGHPAAPGGHTQEHRGPVPGGPCRPGEAEQGRGGAAGRPQTLSAARARGGLLGAAAPIGSGVRPPLPPSPSLLRGGLQPSSFLKEEGGESL